VKLVVHTYHLKIPKKYVKDVSKSLKTKIKKEKVVLVWENIKDANN
jgi:hypothetical protein